MADPNTQEAETQGSIVWDNLGYEKKDRLRVGLWGEEWVRGGGKEKPQLFKHHLSSIHSEADKHKTLPLSCSMADITNH